MVKEAHQLLKAAPGIRYVGNVEGRDIPNAEVRGQDLDVVVCDGFVGNVVLKFYESVARVVVTMVKRAAADVIERPDVKQIFAVLDYSSYGGAPLLGVKGATIICHGSSTPNAIRNAIRVAAQMVESHLSQHIGAEMAEGGVVA